MIKRILTIDWDAFVHIPTKLDYAFGESEIFRDGLWVFRYAQKDKMKLTGYNQFLESH